MSDSTLIPNTRERILSLLRENKTVTVSELSRSWGLTRADIRYHLNLLISEGLVEIAPRDPARSAQRGRPILRYRLSTAQTPSNLPALCSVLLKQLLENETADQQIRVLRILARNMAGDPCKSPSLTQRINKCIDFLNKHAYKAFWEAAPIGPRIMLRNCPYAAILEQHPELCQYDQFLLEELVQIPFMQIARMNRATENPNACIFVSSRDGSV